MIDFKEQLKRDVEQTLETEKDIRRKDRNKRKAAKRKNKTKK